MWQLTGSFCRSVCTAGFKELWNRQSGYPDREFFKALDLRLTDISTDRLSGNVKRLSDVAGYVTEEASAMTGLAVGTPVAPAIIDAHATAFALGITHSGELLMIIGTSGCHIVLSEEKRQIPGIAGVVRDGIADGLYAYEAGQPCVGDSFDWFVNNCLPASYFSAAETAGVDIYTYLEKKAKELPAGPGGLLSLDWWNGSRTPYIDGGLSGVLLGLGTETLPEEIYRSLIEGSAYGTRRIIELYAENGIKISKLYSAGGISDKNRLLLQIYADVIGRDITVCKTPFASAYGSALLASVCGGAFRSFSEATDRLVKHSSDVVVFNAENHSAYNSVYGEYKSLGDYFAIQSSRTMKLLHALKTHNYVDDLNIKAQL